MFLAMSKNTRLHVVSTYLNNVTFHNYKKIVVYRISYIVTHYNDILCIQLFYISIIAHFRAHL